MSHTVRISPELYHTLKEIAEIGESIDDCVDRLLSSAITREKQPAATWPPAMERRHNAAPQPETQAQIGD